MSGNRACIMATASAIAFAATAFLPSNALTVTDENGVEGSEDLADDTQYDGVVQIFMIAPSGGIFFNCTGSLINARTVISAAHCFNDIPSTDYGLESGQFTPIIAYGPDTFDGLFNWLNTGSLVLDDRNGITFGNQLIAHPDADPAFGGLNFPSADVALISLNDPLANLPTYSMLFSPLSVGTHMQQVAYGGHGTGSTGNIGIDGKRQAGENILGLVGSQNDFLRGAFNSSTAGVFPNPSGDQLLYFTDFDRPDRDTSECSRQTFFIGPNDLVCDFGPYSPPVSADGTSATFVNDSIDWFPGDALANEAGTAGGDSGSALFADQLIEDQLIITAVLSGGFTFTSPAPSGYGDISYYNPLFLFHNFISQANPYKYVSATAGDGNWSDGNHWVQNLDPAYLIIDADGNVINGLPTGTELGVAGTDPRSGVVFDTDINDILPAGANGMSDTGSASEGGLSGISATNTASNLQLIANSDGSFSASAESRVELNTGFASNVQVSAATRPADGLVAQSDPDIGEDAELSTFVLGEIDGFGAFSGPGATGGVPNNGRNDAGFINYFDVTLNQAGTTTADIDVTIDRLTIDNASATLAIAEGTQFLSIIDTQIAQGTLDVNGVFASRDILNGGRITGGANGVIVADTLFNLGVLSAGGGLEVDGDLVLTSVGALEWSGTTLDVTGDVAYGGLVVFTDLTPNQSGTLINYAGTAIGEFDTSLYTGARQLTFSYNDSNVTFDYSAQDFTQFLSGTGLTSNELSLAGLLDAARATDFLALQELYDAVDFLPANILAENFVRISPDATFHATGLSALGSQSLPIHIGRRIDTLRAGGGGGTSFSQISASSFQVASLDETGIMQMMMQADSEPGTGAGDGERPAGSKRYGFFGEVSGSYGSQKAGIGALDTDIDGYSITLGADGDFSDVLTLGAYISYSSGDADFKSGLGTSSADGFTIGAYGAYDLDKVHVSAYAGLGQRDFDTARQGFSSTLMGATDADEILAGIAVIYDLPPASDNGFLLIPEARLDYQNFDIAGYTETGGLGSLNIADRDYSSAQLKLGGDLHMYDTREPGSLRPSLGARIVYELDAARDKTDVSLVGSSGQTTTILGAERAQAWGEVDAALNFGSNQNNYSGALYLGGTLGREELEYITLGARFKTNF